MNWQFISFFGDSTVILPSMVVTLVILLVSRSSRTLALQWGVLFGFTGFIVSLSKLAFMGWGIGIPALNFTGFSGHSALSMAFWPIFLWVLASAALPALRLSAALIGYLLAAFIGYSRLAVHAHSVSEVVAGLTLGAAASLGFFILQTAKTDRVSLRRIFFGVIIVPLCLLNTGAKAPTQSLLGELAVRIGPLDKVYTRGEMLDTLLEKR